MKNDCSNSTLQKNNVPAENRQARANRRGAKPFVRDEPVDRSPSKRDIAGRLARDGTIRRNRVSRPRTVGGQSLRPPPAADILMAVGRRPSARAKTL